MEAAEYARGYLLAMGTRIRNARHNAGLTIEQLANISGVQSPLLVRMESHGENLTVERVARVEWAMNLPAGHFQRGVVPDVKIPTPRPIDPWWLSDPNERKNLLYFRRMNGVERKYLYIVMASILAARGKRYKEVANGQLVDNAARNPPKHYSDVFPALVRKKPIAPRPSPIQSQTGEYSKRTPAECAKMAGAKRKGEKLGISAAFLEIVAERMPEDSPNDPTEVVDAGLIEDYTEFIT